MVPENSVTLHSMNLLLLNPSDVIDNFTVVRGRQFEYLKTVHKAEVGDKITLGIVNGGIGTGVIKSINNESANIELTIESAAPRSLPLTIILALPRPKMLRRVLQTMAAMGVKDIYLVNCSRVEKSYWQSPLLERGAIEEQLLLGLEQAKDTVFPIVHLRKLFKPFVQDELHSIAAGSLAITAHPGTNNKCPINCSSPVTLAIGPEGGFIPYEIELLKEQGFDAVHLGPRILRVENAVPALVSRLFPA